MSSATRRLSKSINKEKELSFIDKKLHYPICFWCDKDKGSKNKYRSCHCHPVNPNFCTKNSDFQREAAWEKELEEEANKGRNWWASKKESWKYAKQFQNKKL